MIEFNTLQQINRGRGSWKTRSYTITIIYHVMGLGDQSSSDNKRLYSDNRMILYNNK